MNTFGDVVLKRDLRTNTLSLFSTFKSAGFQLLSHVAICFEALKLIESQNIVTKTKNEKRNFVGRQSHFRLKA